MDVAVADSKAIDGLTQQQLVSRCCCVIVLRVRSMHSKQASEGIEAARGYARRLDTAALAPIWLSWLNDTLKKIFGRQSFEMTVERLTRLDDSTRLTRHTTRSSGRLAADLQTSGRRPMTANQKNVSIT